MKNDNLRLSSSECIRAQIQREEIEKIIIAQRRRAETKSVDLMSQMSFTRRSQKQTQKTRLQSAFTIRKSRQKKSEKKYDKVADLQPGLDLNEQINYFSIKKGYQKIMRSSFDQKIVSQLRSELTGSFSWSNRHSQQVPKTSNFFQKVFTKDNKIQRYFNHLKRMRIQKEKSSNIAYNIELQKRKDKHK